MTKFKLRETYGGELCYNDYWWRFLTLFDTKKEKVKWML